MDFALPADTILETIGAQAVAHPKALTYGTLSSDVQTRDGALMAKVPRYFSTLATQWTLEQVGQDPLITRERPGDHVHDGRGTRPEVVVSQGTRRTGSRHRPSRASSAPTGQRPLLQRFRMEGAQPRHDRDTAVAACHPHPLRLVRRLRTDKRCIVRAIVFGDQPKQLMDSLIQKSGTMPADVSVPLEVEDTGGRSGWHTVNDDHRQLGEPPAFGYGSWVHCVWPTAFLRDHLGPHALLSDEALSRLEVPCNHVHKREGQYWAQVPRFFRTVGVRWSTVYGSSRWQGHSSNDAGDGATVSSLDLEYNLATHDPNLIVGPTGPVFYQDPDGQGHNVAQRRFEATLPLAGVARKHTGDAGQLA